MKRIALIVGHEVYGKDKGALNYKGETESSYNYRICNKILEVIQKRYSSSMYASVFLRDGKGVSGVADMVAKWKPDLSIEFHFNSFNGIAKGCEALALQDDIESIKFADLVTDIISKRLQISERHGNGVLVLNRLSRGFRNLALLRDKQHKPFPKIIIEPVFANKRTKESEMFFEKESYYVEAILHAIRTHFGIHAQPAVEKKEIKVVEDKISLNPLDLTQRLFDYWRAY